MKDRDRFIPKSKILTSITFNLLVFLKFYVYSAYMGMGVGGSASHYSMHSHMHTRIYTPLKPDLQDNMLHAPN